MQCSECGQERSNDQFAWKRIGAERHRHCRDCQRKRSAEWYRQNKAKHVGNVQVNNRRYKEELTKLLNGIKDVPCVDCKVKYPHWVMQFDHREGDKKMFHVSIAPRRQMAKARVLAEVAKCDVVCANCHCTRTHIRRIKKMQDKSAVI